MIITVFVYIKKVSHLTSQLGIFVITFTVKRFHIYGALLHLALKVFTFTGPYYICDSTTPSIGDTGTVRVSTCVHRAKVYEAPSRDIGYSTTFRI